MPNNTGKYLYGDLLETTCGHSVGTKVRILARRDGQYLVQKGKAYAFQVAVTRVGNLRRDA